MKAAVVTFLRGAGWLLDGWRMFRAAPLAWLAIVIAYWFLMVLIIALVPKIGLVIVALLVPVLSVGFMAVSRASARATQPGLAEMASGFRERLPALLLLGAVYFVLMASLFWATTLADGGALARWALSGERPALEVLRSEEFRNALWVAALGYAPVMMLYWFAPVLVAWHGIAVAKAMFFSFAACLVNWRAFTGYSLAATLLTVVVPSLLMGALLVLSGGKLLPALDRVMGPIVLLLLPVIYASFYASYRDVFGTPGAPAPGEPVPQ